MCFYKEIFLHFHFKFSHFRRKPTQEAKISRGISFDAVILLQIRQIFNIILKFQLKCELIFIDITDVKYY